jgi:hypothetical protein
MEIDINNIYSGNNTNIGILLYIKNNISIAHEIKRIESGQSSDVRINSYFQNSPDYLKLQQRISQQYEKIKGEGSQLTKEELEYEKKMLKNLNEADSLFKTNALKLAGFFLKIRSRTPTLEKAVNLFEQGLIEQADKIIDDQDLLDDQEILLAQMAYLLERKKILLR